MKAHSRWVYAVAIATVAVLAVGVVAGLRDVGDDSPEQAVYALAHAIEHDDADGACERMVTTSAVPGDVRESLDVRPLAAGRASADCVSGLRSRADFEAFGFEDALVSEVRPVEVASTGDVSDAAVADVRLEDERQQQVPLVRHRGRWKVVGDR